jgi:hypothetical protein
MSKGEQAQSDADIMEWIAFGSVVVFGLGMAYAIHVTNETVDSVNANHYNANIVQSEQLEQPEDGAAEETSSEQQQPSTAN